MMITTRTVQGWLAAVAMLMTFTTAKGIRGERRVLEFDTQHNDLYNGSQGGVNGEAHEILHQVDFPGHLDILMNDAEAGDGRDDSDANDEESSKSSKNPKSTKAPKHHRKRPRAEHHKKTKGTIMPTVSSAPSSMPSVSNQPSVSAAPSSSPTVSAMPSVSSSPSSTPTDSSMPTMSAAPSSTPVMISAGATEPTSLPVVPGANSPSPVPMIEVLTKFALRYALDDDTDPTTDEFFALSKVTGWYLGNHTLNHYSSSDSVTFLKTDITSYYEPSPLIVDFDAMSCFDQLNTYPIPSNDELNGVIAFALTARADQYMVFLKNHLASSNPFSSVTLIDYSAYWDALVSQSSTASSSSQPIDEANSKSKKIFAPIIAIASTVILVAGIFIVARERKRRNDASRVNANRWDETGANLHMSKTKAEEDMVILDDQLPSGEHSFRPSIQATLSTVDEVDSDDGAVVMGETTETSPSQVMREMNLSSALEDVDLDSDKTGGIGELPRNNNGGIGELPGRRENY